MIYFFASALFSPDVRYLIVSQEAWFGYIAVGVVLFLAGSIVALRLSDRVKFATSWQKPDEREQLIAIKIFKKSVIAFVFLVCCWASVLAAQWHWWYLFPEVSFDSALAKIMITALLFAALSMRYIVGLWTDRDPEVTIRLAKRSQRKMTIRVATVWVLLFTLVGAGIFFLSKTQVTTRTYTFDKSIDAISLIGNMHANIRIEPTESIQVEVRATKKILETIEMTDTFNSRYDRDNGQLPARSLKIFAVTNRVNEIAYGEAEVTITIPSLTYLEANQSAGATVSGGCMIGKFVHLSVLNWSFPEREQRQVRVGCIEGESVFFNEFQAVNSQKSDSISLGSVHAEQVLSEGARIQDWSFLQAKKLDLLVLFDMPYRFSVILPRVEQLIYCARRDIKLVGEKAWYEQKMLDGTAKPEEFCSNKDPLILK